MPTSEQWWKLSWEFLIKSILQSRWWHFLDHRTTFLQEFLITYAIVHLGQGLTIRVETQTLMSTKHIGPSSKEIRTKSDMRVSKLE